MIIRSGTIVAERVIQGDLRIEGKLIKEIATHIDARDDEEIIDASGCYVFPGAIDAHTHFGLENPVARTSDDYKDGTKAALLGGTTTIINFTTGHPGEDLHEAFFREKERAKDSSCHTKFHVELVEVNEKRLEELKDLVEQEGVTSAKIYMAYGFRLSDREIYRALLSAKETGILIESHCETGDVLDEIMKDLVKEGKNTACGQHLAHPREAEAESISRLTYFAKLADVPVHIVHLSTKMGLEEVKKARALGVKVTAETCPQYLVLDDSVYDQDPKEAAKFVFAPPARKKEDQQAILEGIVQGEIQTMATDHCSFSYEEKMKAPGGDLRRIAGGIPGAEHRLGISYTELIGKGAIDETHFVELLATNPAKLYGMYPRKGVLAVGSDADIVIYDKSATFTISKDTQNSPVDFTPYEGYLQKGAVRDVFLEGRRVVKDGELILAAQGRYID